jgi:hypothetical protein
MSLALARWLLRRHLRRLELKMAFGEFDPTLSLKIDAVRVALEALR